MTDHETALFIAGIAAGLFIYRMIVEITCKTPRLTICDICKYGNRKADKKAARRRPKLIDQIEQNFRDNDRRINVSYEDQKARQRLGAE